MDTLELVRRRIAAQHLTGTGLGDPAAVVGFLGAVQAQEPGEARWSLAQRCDTPPDAEVIAALDRGEILRTHVLRPTWHYVHAADIRWMLRLSGERLARLNARRRSELELDERTIERGRAVVAEALAGGRSMIRAELVAALEAAGLDVGGQRFPHLITECEWEGLVCSGPLRGNRHTFALLSERVPAAVDRAPDDPLAELARRFFASHGPARVKDFAWWSGLPMAEARRALEGIGDELEVIESLDGETFHAPAGCEPAPESGLALLLGAFDETHVAYREPRIVHAGPERPMAGSAPARLVLIDGCTVATWRWRAPRDSDLAEVGIEPLDALTDAAAEAITAEAGRFARFLGRELSLSIG